MLPVSALIGAVIALCVVRIIFRTQPAGSFIGNLAPELHDTLENLFPRKSLVELLDRDSHLLGEVLQLCASHPHEVVMLVDFIPTHVGCSMRREQPSFGDSGSAGSKRHGALAAAVRESIVV